MDSCNPDQQVINKETKPANYETNNDPRTRDLFPVNPACQ